MEYPTEMYLAIIICVILGIYGLTQIKKVKKEHTDEIERGKAEDEYLMKDIGPTWRYVRDDKSAYGKYKNYQTFIFLGIIGIILLIFILFKGN